MIIKALSFLYGGKNCHCAYWDLNSKPWNFFHGLYQVEEHIRMPFVPGFAQSVSNWAAAPRPAQNKPTESVTQRGGSFLLLSYRQFNKACKGCVQSKTSVSTDIFRLLCCLK